MSFVLAILALILIIVLWATHQLSVELAGILALLAVAILAGGAPDLSGFFRRSPPA